MEFLVLNLRVHPGKFGTENCWHQGEPVPSLLPWFSLPAEPTSGGTVEEDVSPLLTTVLSEHGWTDMLRFSF